MAKGVVILTERGIDLSQASGKSFVSITKGERYLIVR